MGARSRSSVVPARRSANNHSGPSQPLAAPCNNEAYSPMNDELRHLPLEPLHLAIGARMSPFAGWEMPLRYGSEVAEHMAVRKDAGVFDISHMGRFRVTGPEAGSVIA